MDDCTRCGTCCFSESPRHVRVTGDDYERLGDDAESLVRFEENQAFMRVAEIGTTGIRACAALEVDPRTRRFACRVYARRPAICRDLARGGVACEGEIATKGERPRRVLTLLAP